jgi:membrane-bound ClpP family serine protease
VVAALLLIFDLFIPTGGILSILAVGLLLSAVVVCFYINRWLGLASLFALVVASPFVAAGLVAAWKHTPFARRMILDESVTLATPRVTPVRVGSEGTTLSMLRPMGEAEFDGGHVGQATSETGDLPPGTRVRVVHYKDGLATVRPV